MTILGLVEHKRAARAMWAAGDYPSVAERELWPLGERIVARAGVRPGEDVLDIGCGTGNAAIRAAQAGGRVVGVDLTPELFGAARRLASAARVEVEWVEGDAEALCFADQSFDVVVSAVGVMFAPRHEAAAREMVRVLRPGGRFVLCNWADDSAISDVFRAAGRYLPPPPDAASPPWLWGSADHVRSLFSGAGIELTFECGTIELPAFESADAEIEYHTTRLGPLIAARQRAEAGGRWPQLRGELASLHERLASVSYLVTAGRKLAPGHNRLP